MRSIEDFYEFFEGRISEDLKILADIIQALHHGHVLAILLLSILNLELA